MVVTAQDTKLKPGYKQTEVGMIPEDWEVKKLQDVAPLQRGFDLPTSQVKAGVFPVVYSNGVLNYHSSFKVKAPGVVTGRSGTIGKVNYVEDDYWPHNTSLWVTNFKGNLPKFIYYLYTYIKLERFGTGSGVPTLNRNDVHTYQIPLPSLPEQHAIASTLSEVDALIAALDKLIAKKRDIKQATMQQLLTGKKRMPGFGRKIGYKQTEIGVIPEDWEVHTLGDKLDHLDAGISVNSVDEEFHLYENEQAILKTSAVSNGYFFPYECKKIAPKDIKRAKLNPRANSIIISRMNTIDLVGECGYVDKNYSNLFLPDRLWIMTFKRNSKVNVKWLSYVLSYKKYKATIKLAATGTSGSMKNISKSSLLSINIPFPAPDEQLAIATILSDMDAEIVALEQKRNKTQALKQGMMQELLTGKTRLI